jgi:hypothetical protein
MTEPNEFLQITQLAAQYWGSVPCMFHKLPDGAWAVNTNGLGVERLGSTLAEIEQFMKDHPRTPEGEKKKFENALLQFGIGVDSD